MRTNQNKLSEFQKIFLENHDPIEYFKYKISRTPLEERCDFCKMEKKTMTEANKEQKEKMEVKKMNKNGWLVPSIKNTEDFETVAVVFSLKPEEKEKWMESFSVFMKQFMDLRTCYFWRALSESEIHRIYNVTPDDKQEGLQKLIDKRKIKNDLF